MSGISFKAKFASFIAVLLVIVVVISIPIGVTQFKKNNEKTPETPETPKTTETPFDSSELKDEELNRIDCFLDAQSKFENLTKYACEKRNCIFNPNIKHSKVPKCYFNRTNLGYKLNQKNGNSFLLDRSGADPPFMGFIEKLKLDVEYSGNNMIRVKVSSYLLRRFIIDYF